VKLYVDTLTGGTDDYSVTAGEIELAYDKFEDTENLDINLVLGGPSSGVADTVTGHGYSCNNDYCSLRNS
jgi:hypothetical protein